MAASNSVTTIYIGNLKNSARLIEIKASLLKLFQKALKVHVSSNDISIINGTKRYALVDVHHEQNVDFILENLSDSVDRKKIKFNFDSLVEPGTFLYVDKVKSQDDKQAKDDFENAKNPKPFQKPHLHVRKRPEYDVIIPLKPAQPSTRSGSRLSSSTLKSESQRGQKVQNPFTSESYPSTDLDVTLTDEHSHTVRPEEFGEALNKKVNMIPLADSTLKTEDDSEDSGTQMDSVPNRTISSIHGDGDDFDNSPEPQEYEDPPGSVIDLRHVSRASFQGKLTPRIHRRTARKPVSTLSLVIDRHVLSSRTFSVSSTPVACFHLDVQGGETPESQREVTPKAETGPSEDEGTPYYRPGEVVYNNDLTKEFKSYLEGKYTLKQIRDHVSRCVCAFLNTGQKGMLLIGVDSRGKVVGIDCDVKQEDRFRRHFLDAVKDIYPPVFGEEYSIHFSPLLEDNGRQHPSLKVIEIRVFPPESPDVLYECKEGVYVRRNGVLTGPIRPSHIQEWIKQKHFAELNEMHGQERFMKDELDKKDDMIRRQADTIMSQKSEIERQKHIIESRGCVII